MRAVIHPLTLLVLCLAVVSPSVAAEDVAGSADYPDIGRFADSAIKSYKVENYGKTVLATGPVRSARDAAKTARRVEGKITRILYRVPPGTSALEVFRNFQARVGEAGYESIFSGGPGEIRPYEFKYKHPVEILDKISIGNEIYYLSAKKSSGAGEIYLSVLVSPHSGGDGQRVRVIAAETKTMEMQMADAKKMQLDIGATGKVVLYGIYFEHDRASIKPESKATLDEIAKLLSSQSSLKLIVVGHTDHSGRFDYNMDLSQRRARAVADALIAEYGIARNRLRSEGVGYLAPAASNDTDQGRTLNRRVELVKDR